MYTKLDLGVAEECFEIYEPILVSEKDELVCLKKAKEGDEDYANYILTKYYNYVVSIAKKYQNCGVYISDLVVEGLFGAYEALQRFNPDMGNQFSTYAHEAIKGKILRKIENDGRTIRVPCNVLTEAWKVKKTFDEMGDLATYGSVAERLGIAEKKVRNHLETLAPIVELDSYVDDEETTLCDLIPDDNDCDKLERIHSMQAECIREIAKAFTEEESKLLRVMFNFDSEWNSCGAPMNLNAAAKELGVSYSVAKRIFKSAKAKFIRGNEKYHIESLAA